MIAALALAALLQGSPIADPLAPARSGQVQCYLPDAARKVCRSMGIYRLRADGKYDHKAVIVISNDPFITLETHEPVEVKGGAVCSVLTAADLDAGVYLLEGTQPLNAAQMGVVRPLLDQQLAPIYGREICTTYLRTGATITGQVRIAGAREPDRDLGFIWAPETDGWRVAP